LGHDILLRALGPFSMHSRSEHADLAGRLSISPLQSGRSEETRQMVRQDVADAWTMNNVKAVVKEELIPTGQHRVEARLRMQIRERRMVGVERESRPPEEVVELAQREYDSQQFALGGRIITFRLG